MAESCSEVVGSVEMVVDVVEKIVYSVEMVVDIIEGFEVFVENS